MADKNKDDDQHFEKRRCTECQENVNYAVRVRFPETTFPTPTDTPEESSTQTSRQSQLRRTELRRE